MVAAALERVDPSNDVEILGYLTALRDLGGKLPKTVRDCVLAHSATWISSSLERDFLTE